MYVVGEVNELAEPGIGLEAQVGGELYLLAVEVDRALDWNSLSCLAQPKHLSGMEAALALVTV